MSRWEPTQRPSTISHFTEFIWNNGKVNNPDITIIVKGEKIFAHRTVLEFASDYVNQLLRSDKNLVEIKIPDDFKISPSTVRDMLSFEYNHKINITAENVSDLETASTKLGFIEILNACKRFRKEADDKVKSSELSSRKNVAVESKLVSDPLASGKRPGAPVPWGADYYSPEYLWKPHVRGSNFLHFLHFLWDQNRNVFSDVTIITGGVSYRAHKMILSCHSYYFADLFSKSPHATEIMLPRSYDISASTFYKLLKFMYTNVLDVEPRNASAIYHAAVILKMTQLVGSLESSYFKEPYKSSPIQAANTLYNPNTKGVLDQPIGPGLQNIGAIGNNPWNERALDLPKQPPISQIPLPDPVPSVGMLGGGYGPNVFQQQLPQQARPQYIPPNPTAITADYDGNNSFGGNIPIISQPRPQPQVAQPQSYPSFYGQPLPQFLPRGPPQGMAPIWSMAPPQISTPILMPPNLPYQYQQLSASPVVKSLPAPMPMTNYNYMPQALPPQPYLGLDSRMRGQFPAASYPLNSVAFMELSCDMVCAILSNDDLIASSEFEVFKAALNWLKYKQDRSVHTDQIMKCVRFARMDKRTLLKVVGISRDWFMRNDTYREMVLKANWFMVTEDNNVKTIISDPIPRLRNRIPKEIGAGEGYGSYGANQLSMTDFKGYNQNYPYESSNMSLGYQNMNDTNQNPCCQQCKCQWPYKSSGKRICNVCKRPMPD